MLLKKEKTAQIDYLENWPEHYYEIENTKERKEGSIKETETPEQVIGLNTENSELNEGIAETIIKMSRKGYEAEQISDILDMTAEEVREIIENE